MITHEFTVLNNLPCTVFILNKNFDILEQYGAIHFQLTEKERKSFFSLPFLMSEGGFILEKCIKQHLKSSDTYFSRSVIYMGSENLEQLALLNIKKCDELQGCSFVAVLCNIEEEKECLLQQTEQLLNGLKNGNNIETRIVGRNEKMLEINRLIRYAADSDATVLISGESGTGKELVADAIHYNSKRKNKPFIKVNCAALSETLLESELFGHVKGSFTGAYKDKKGKFEMAHGGSIFLDEISEISPALQVKLLRVIQEKTLERVGDNKTIKVDMRIMAATNKNLRELTQNNAFREDLFYRLNVFNINTIPLRDRKNDIPLLCRHFIEKFNISTGKNIKDISKNAYRLLMDYCWPGNVRELENVIEHAYVVVEKNTIDIFDFPQELRLIAYRDGICKKEQNTPDYLANSENIIQKPFKSISGRIDLDKQALIKILEDNAWNQTKTAKVIGISRVALWKKMKKMGVL